MMPSQPPPGYPEITLDASAQPYRWKDYVATLEYLRRETRPDERVANLLRVVPALTGPSGRLPALPAESLAWLLVKPDDEPRFLKALEESRNAVVIWSPREPDENRDHRLVDVVRRLAPAVRDHYHPVARFGAIEVWLPGRATESRSGPSRSSHNDPAWASGSSINALSNHTHPKPVPSSAASDGSASL
jgi:hypothetical protein